MTHICGDPNASCDSECGKPPPTYLLAMDAETGGYGLNKTLLTLYLKLFVYVEGQICPESQELYLRIKPNDSAYLIDPEALEVNKINLVEHHKIAITEKQAGTVLYKFLEECNKIAKSKLVPVGHSVAPDIEQVLNKIMSPNTFYQFVSHKTIDTCGLAQFYVMTHLIPYGQSCSLGALGTYFKCDMSDGELHDAKFDTLLCVRVLESLIKLK